MSTRTEKAVAYEATPVTRIPLSELDEENQARFETWMRAVIINNDDVEWVEGGGVGGYNGLSERLTESFDGSKAEFALPQCASCEDCGLEAEIDSADGDISRASLILRCPSIRELKKKDADERESKCLTAHSEARDAFGDFLIERTAAIDAAEKGIQAAKAALSEAEIDLRDLV